MPDRRDTLKALAAAGLLGPAGISGLIRDALAKGEVPLKTGCKRSRGKSSSTIGRRSRAS
jgi:hypothetical protein